MRKPSLKLLLVVASLFSSLAICQLDMCAKTDLVEEFQPLIGGARYIPGDSPDCSIGVSLSHLSDRITKKLYCYKIEDVLPDSPAQAAGLHRGDKITEIDGRIAAQNGDLRYNLRGPCGSKVVLSLERHGAQQKVAVERKAISTNELVQSLVSAVKHYDGKDLNLPTRLACVGNTLRFDLFDEAQSAAMAHQEFLLAEKIGGQGNIHSVRPLAREAALCLMNYAMESINVMQPPPVSYIEQMEQLYKELMARAKNCESLDREDALDVAECLYAVGGAVTIVPIKPPGGRLYTMGAALSERGVAIAEKLLGPDDPRLIPMLDILQRIYSRMHRTADDLRVDERIVAIGEKHFLHTDKSNLVQLLGSSDSLARDYTKLHRYAEAEQLSKRRLADVEELLGPEDEYNVRTLQRLAWVYEAAEKYDGAEDCYKRMIALIDRHPDYFQGAYLACYADLLKKLNRADEAEKVLRRRDELQKRRSESEKQRGQSPKSP